MLAILKGNIKEIEKLNEKLQMYYDYTVVSDFKIVQVKDEVYFYVTYEEVRG